MTCIKYYSNQLIWSAFLSLPGVSNESPQEIQTKQPKTSKRTKIKQNKQNRQLFECPDKTFKLIQLQVKILRDTEAHQGASKANSSIYRNIPVHYTGD